MIQYTRDEAIEYMMDMVRGTHPESTSNHYTDTRTAINTILDSLEYKKCENCEFLFGGVPLGNSLYTSHGCKKYIQRSRDGGKFDLTFGCTEWEDRVYPPLH